MTCPDRSVPAAGAARREHTGEELRAQLARYQALVEYAPDAIMILDVDAGRFETVNAAAEELFGTSRAELLRVGPAELSPPLQPDGRPSQIAALEYIGRALAGDRPRFEWTHRRADGIDVPCEVRLLRLPDPGRRLVRGSIVDLTERRATEAALAEQAARRAAEQAARQDADTARRAAEAGAARLQATVSGLNAIVWERDPATLRLTFVNERAAELLGYPASRWLADGGLWARILHPDDREAVLTGVRDAVDSGMVDFVLSYRVRAAGGRWVWLQHLGHVARDDDGTPRTLHAVLVDITETRRREQATGLLAAAGRALVGLRPVEQRLASVAELLVETLGDWAAVWLRGDDDRFRPVAAAPAALAAAALAVGPLRVPPAFVELVDAGQAFAVPEVTEPLLREAAADEEQYAALAALGGRTWLAASLWTGSEAVGLMTVATDHRSSYDDGDVALVAELAQRIATMVAAEGVAARQEQLHRLTTALAAAGTATEAAAALTTSLHEALGAAFVAVCTLGEDGQLHTLDVHGDSPEWRAGFTTIRVSNRLPLTDAARTLRPVWLPDRAAMVDRYPEVARLLRAETQATASLPLLVGDRLVGAVAVVFRRPRAFDTAERAFLLSVAGQVAAALERAALADVRREMAEALQRSLLPVRLPSTDRLSVAARYLPAVTGTAAGGDWYDVLTVTDDCVALVVGDVVGHGAAAAAVMGRLSSTLSGLLLAGHRPARALERLDHLAGQIDGAGLATVACLLLDLAGGRLTLSNAGHPPPLLAAADGSITLLDDGHGPALGVPGAGQRPEAVTTLPTGDTLLLYTDGLVERRDGILDDGLARLAAAAAARPALPLPDLVDGVLSDMLGGRTADDDVAVLAARLLPERTDLAGVLGEAQRRAFSQAVPRTGHARRR